MKIYHSRDFWAGLMFVGFGMFFASFGIDYRIGTAASMGAGFFPTVLGVVLLLIGAVIAATARAPQHEGEQATGFAWKTAFLILGPVVLFGLLLHKLGLVLCLLMLVALSSLASEEFSFKATLGNAAVLIALCLFVFIYALKLQFPLWPMFGQLSGMGGAA